MEERATHEEQVPEKPNGLLMHEEVQLSQDEIRAERRLVWKIDLIILPLLSLMYFLASMVGRSHTMFLSFLETDADSG